MRCWFPKTLFAANRFKYFADNEAILDCPSSVEQISSDAEIFAGISDGISCSVTGWIKHPCGLRGMIRLPLSPKIHIRRSQQVPEVPQKAALAPARAAFCFSDILPQWILHVPGSGPRLQLPFDCQVCTSLQI